MMPVEIEPQPRIDTLVRVPGGAERRRTEYLGTVWLNGKPQIDGLRLLRPASAPKGVSLPEKNVSFFLPDSLAYARERLGDAQLSVTASARAIGENGALIETVASFVDDPSGAPTWVNLRALAFSGWPLGISYRVVALTAPDAAG
ncbi:MAG TPA: hypothetical protein VFO49_02575 [Nocardioides sp.]|nr:hypothetical protein [Nocardioides sp.]